MHTGAHKINNALGQALVAQRLGKQRIIAETGAGQHGVATATVCALSASSASSTWAARTCVGRRRTSSACACSARRSRPVEFGTRTLKEATSEAIRDWIANVETTYYLIGSWSARRRTPSSSGSCNG